MMNYLSSPLPKKIVKGDQNLLWDGFFTDIALQNLLLGQYTQERFLPFIHDEKIGAADVNIVYCLKDQTAQYMLTEDYADSAGDACYVNIDGSYGLFYLPVVEEDRLKEFGISVRAKSKQFIKIFPHLDETFIRECAEAGLELNFSEPVSDTIGPLLHQDVMDCYFNVHPFQQFFYLFSKSHGRYGIVPSEDRNILLSSLDCAEPVFQQSLKAFLQLTFFDGTLRYSDPSHLDSVRQRIQSLNDYLEINGAWKGNYTNWQQVVVRHMEQAINTRFPVSYTQSSEIFQQPKNYDIQHTMQSILFEQPFLFMECYNEALNETRMSIQRMVIQDSLLNIPYYVNRRFDRNQYYRTALFMDVRSRKLYFREQGQLQEWIPEKSDGFITGKAIPFLNELRMNGNAIALPESGSKYTPACKAMIRLLRERGISVQVTNIIRIGLHFLDHLYLQKEYQLLMPPILQPFFGDSVSTESFSQTWRTRCDDIREILHGSKRWSEDQQIRLVEEWLSDPAKKALSFMDTRLKSILLKTFQAYQIAKEAKQNKASELSIEAFRIEKWKLNLLVDFYKQRLVQVMDGLYYLNDRPYSLSLFLMFGPSFFRELLSYVTFREETE